MANTPNLDLVKPAGTDKALVSVINSNSDKIDAGFGSLSDQIGTLNSKTTPVWTNLGTGINKCKIGKFMIVNFMDASIPVDGIATGENISNYLFSYGNPVGDGWIRNTGNKLIWKNGEAATGIYITWFGVLE